MSDEAKVKRLDHIGIAVADITAAKAFLESLGLKATVDYEKPDWLKASFFPIGDTALALLEMADPEVARRRLRGEPAARIDHLCFEVDSLDETVVFLKSEGVSVSGGEFEGPEGDSVEETREGTTRSVFTKEETSSGYLFQFIETGDTSVADDLAALNEA